MSVRLGRISNRDDNEEGVEGQFLFSVTYYDDGLIHGEWKSKKTFEEKKETWNLKCLFKTVYREKNSFETNQRYLESITYNR